MQRNNRMRIIGDSLDAGYRDDLNFNFGLISTLVAGSSSENEKLKEELDAAVKNLQTQINLLTGENIDELIARLNDSAQQALEAAQNARIATDATEEATNLANVATSLANASAVLADEKANYADEKAILAQKAAENANIEASNLGQLKVDVVQATQDANTATNNANEATGKAIVATNAINVVLPNVTGLENKTSWMVSISYKKNNFVTFNGNGYMALRDNVGVTPPLPPSTSNDDWSLYTSKGEKGEKGTGVNILGSLNSKDDLPISGSPGDGYLINGDLYVWSETTLGWENVGIIKGPKGDTGDQGPKGDTGLPGKDADLTEVNEKVSELQTELTEHISQIASTEKLGHVKVDGDTITVDPKTGIAKVIGGNSIGGIPVDVSNIKNGEGIAYDASSNNFIPSKDISKPIIYGIKINTLNSNPETAVTYTDSATGFTPAKGNNGSFSYGSWQDKFPFNQIKPCLVKDGLVNYYLNPNDYTKKLDGGNADITSGNDGDVMVEFPKIYWKFKTIGNDLYIKYSDKQVDSTYKCLAHTRGVNEKDKIYLSAYMGFSLSSKLRSLSGKTPAVNQNISQFRTLAKANGVGYEQSTYYQILMLQVLFIAMFKNRDSQTALGRGYVDGNSSSIATGGTNAKGMFYSETTGKLQNKFCGIEDFWGNTYYWVDGMFCDASRNILIGNDNYNDTGSGYTNYGQGAVSNLNGYIDKVQGGTETGFIIKSGSGSATTYYADYGNLAASSLPRFGGYWSYSDYVGAFRLDVNNSSSASDSSISARLSLC